MQTHNIKSFFGALNLFNEVLVMYYQIDKNINPTKYYREEFNFMLDVIPEYLTGDSESYIQENTISLFPNTVKKQTK